MEHEPQNTPPPSPPSDSHRRAPSRIYKVQSQSSPVELTHTINAMAMAGWDPEEDSLVVHPDGKCSILLSAPAGTKFPTEEHHEKARKIGLD